MFIVNNEMLDCDELYRCVSPTLFEYLCSVNGLSPISREQNEDGGIDWLFVKTDKLINAINDWSLDCEVKNE